MYVTKQNTNVNNEGQSFQEILFNMMGQAEKNFAMFIAIEQAKVEMQEELEAMGDVVFGSVKVEECPCSRNCGSVKITAEFTAMTFTAEGIEGKEGKIENIITFK